MKIVPIFAGTGSGLHCPKILISTYASRVKFHKSSFWVLILAAGGPYWVSISQKNGSLLGPYLKAWGSLIVLTTVPLVQILEVQNVFFFRTQCQYSDSL